MNAIYQDKDREIELASLLAGVAIVDPIWDRKITGITLDSRQVKSGNLFIACIGSSQDARQFMNDAIERGASAIIAEGNAAEIASTIDKNPSIPIFYATDLKTKIGVIASRFYNHPSRRMKIIGITGTNGKTSCSHFLAEALHTSKEPCGIIGTIGYGIYGNLNKTGLTTPDAIALQALLADFQTLGVQTVTMEVSSHALDQDRVKHVEMETAIFTNLSRDHLDYHKTLEAYGAAKLKLFTRFGLRQAIINIDDPFSETIIAAIQKQTRIFTYSLNNSKANVYASDLVLSTEGIQAKVQTPWGNGILKCQLFGRFNVSNILAVLTTLGAIGIPFKEIMERLNRLRGVLGRMEIYQIKGSARVVIDYAHTPDALEKSLLALREHGNTKISVIFGCGGNRDQGKRALMGAIAEKYADAVILTNDNPRLENPEAIVNEILSGISNKNKVIIEYDRQAALAIALKQASSNDCILMAGKGHEGYQEIGKQRIAISDQHIVESLLGLKKESVAERC